MSDRFSPNYSVLVRHTDLPPRDPLDVFVESLIRDRLEELRLTSSVDEAPSLEMTLRNDDLLWTDPRVRGDTYLEEGTNVTIQVGYFDLAAKDERMVRPPQTFTINKTSDDPKNYRIRAVSSISKFLGASFNPRFFEPQTVSSIVRFILNKNDFDAAHRVIQETKAVLSGVVQNAGETTQAFIARLAKDHNYLFYSEAGEDGKPVIHFHKQGFRPAATEDAEPTETAPGAKFGEPRNGNLVKRTGIIVFRQTEGFREFEDGPTPVLLNVETWRGEQKPSGKAKTARAVGIDLITGRVIDEKVTQSDLDSLSLSQKNLFVEVGERDLQIVEELPVNVGSQNAADARDMAKAALEKSQQRTAEVEITHVGDPRIKAGQIWKLVGFGKHEGDYFVHEVVDVLGNGGYETQIKLSSEGIPTPSAGLTGRGRGERGPEDLEVEVNQDGDVLGIVERGS